MSVTGLVSIIMPNRDHSRYLPRALGAMLAQSWANLEIIVVDDASSDDSQNLIASYAQHDARVRFLLLEAHHGINRAVNAGLKIARGEFVYVAGADDFIEPNFLERCVVEMNRHPDAGLSFSDPTEYREAKAHKVCFPLYLSETPRFFDRASLITLFKRNYFHISANTGLYRTDAFRAAGGYQAELRWLSDWFVTLVIALRHGACYLPEQLTYVTIRSDSYSASNLRDGKAQRLLLKHVLALLASPAYADVAPSLHQAGLLPEYKFRTLFWLLDSAEGRKFVKPKLVGRIAIRSAWSCLRPLVPAQWRRRLRRVQSERTRGT